MKVLKDKKIIILMVILLAYTIVYFTLVAKSSYAFDNDLDYSKLHLKTISIIEESAIKYAEANKNLFEKENTVYIKVQNLIDENLIATNNDDKLIDISNNNELNGKVIKIKQEKEGYKVEVDA